MRAKLVRRRRGLSSFLLTNVVDIIMTRSRVIAHHGSYIYIDVMNFGRSV